MNPNNNNSYRFFLNFKNSFGCIEITEPVKFDGASFVIEQEKGRYGRDVSFMNESLDLFFYKGIYDVSENPLQLPNGTIIYNLTQCFEQLIEDFNNTGWESEIEFIIEKSDVSFITGVLDMFNAETDGLTFISCKVVQDTGRQLIKRREDIVIDMFSNENVDREPITPLQTTNILLKAKPITQESEWFLPNTTAEIGNAVNAINAITKSGIENTLSYIPDGFQNGEECVYLEAQNDLNDVKVKLIDWRIRNNNLDSTTDVFQVVYSVYPIGGFTPDNYIVLDTFPKQTWIQNYNREFTIDFIPRGFRLNIYLFCDSPAFVSTFIFSQGKINIKAVSTAIDSVVKGVRYIDVLKQTVKSINGSTVNAPKFDVGGKYYNQFVFTGNLIKGRNDLPFPVKFKEAYGTIQEVNADYQVNENNVFIGQYADYYPNKELASLPSYPDESSRKSFNERFAINDFEFEYKTFEEDRDEANTTDAIHTKSQWSILNKQVENTKKIDLEQIRGAFKIESARKLAVKTTTAQSDDDKPFLIDVVDLAPNTKGGFSASLNHYIDNGTLKLLNDASFSWNLLGFQVGSVFTILTTSNVGNYTVSAIDNNILSLTGNNPTSIGQAITKVEYALNNVQFTNRTNEGLIYSDNLLNPENYSNLRYSIKRNMKEWFSYLATSFNFLANKELKNTYFKSNGEAETQFNDESNIVIENGTETISETPILTPYIYNVKMVANFETVVNILNGLKTANNDGTIGGFIRTRTNDGKIIKGYPQKLDYEPSTETLTATLEERYENETLTIVRDNDIVTVNEVGYKITELASVWYEIHGDYLTLFDSKGIPLNNPVRFDKVLINGLSFENTILLSNKLIEIS
jgi:hypothetical protein